MTRPTLARGDSGPDVSIVQTCLEANPVDGDFGAITEDAVRRFQRDQDLTADGVVGPATWAALEAEYELPPYPPPPLEPLEPSIQSAIMTMATSSALARYSFKDRGTAPIGYIKGMALAYSTIIRKFMIHRSAALEMAKADTRNDEYDALSYYSDRFDELGMDNSKPGIDTLRHLWVMLIGLGMRESSGQHCCGRDMSADNVSATTCEAGAWQTSGNIEAFSEEIERLLDEYLACEGSWQCALNQFKDDVECSGADWENYGSGWGYDFQRLSKNCPQFAAEVCAVGLRNGRKHWGPIGRYEVEILAIADEFLLNVQELTLPTMV